MLFAPLVLAVIPPSPPLKVRETTYEHLAITSDIVCVGVVESTTPISTSAPRLDPRSGEPESPFDVARLRIREVWKGPPALKDLLFVGSSTWTCDITGVSPGDEV